MEAKQSFAEFMQVVDRVLHYQLFELGQTSVTLLSIVLFVLFILMFFLFSRVLDRLVLRRMLTRFEVESGIQFTMRRVSHYVVMVIGAMMAFQFVGIDLSGLAVIFGLLSVGIGFGLQNIASNFISGVILLLERPIRVGDRVTVGDTEGDVMAINMRSTTIRTLRNITIIVPNSEFIQSNVTNWSHGDPKVRLDVEVGVSYGSDLETVIRCLEEVAAEHPAVLKQPKPLVVLTGFGDSSWNMALLSWLGTPERYYAHRSEINMAIVKKFRENNVEIPFPQRDLHVRSPLPLPHVAQSA